jgi:hypothetical protein
MPASASPEELKAEVQDLHDKGIAGIELGQGAFPGNEQLVALLSKANEFGIKVSLSHGPTQNPAGYSIDDMGIYLTPPTPTYRLRGHGRGFSADFAGVGKAL